MGDSRQIEMSWRCSRCETTNRGRDKVCVTCGDPKDPSERFEMPSDTRAAPTVTDPSLLRQANAGKDWLCRSCGANVSAIEDDCPQCGSRRAQAQPSSRPARPKPPAKQGRSLLRMLLLVFVATTASLVSLAFVGVLSVPAAVLIAQAPERVSVQVDRAHWTKTVTVERYALRQREGFAENKPANALSVESLGMHHHHNEQVVDHYEAEHYKERVSDGFDREPYQEKVACGKTCVPSPKRCREVCKSNDNGFATCNDVCTGGEKRCTTRYCNETRYRQVPRYKMVDRTRKVPVYRTVSVAAERFGWKEWSWAPVRTLVEEGDGGSTRWPAEEEIALGSGVGEGEQERAIRSESYEVSVRAADGRSWPVTVADEATFARYPLGSSHLATIEDGKVSMQVPLR